MGYRITWHNQKQRILLVTYSGRWDGAYLAKQWHDVITLSPLYIIWDLTNTIFLPDAYVIPEAGSQWHRTILDLVAYIQQADFRQLYIVENTSHLAFDTLRQIVRSFKINEKVSWVASANIILEQS